MEMKSSSIFFFGKISRPPLALPAIPAFLAIDRSPALD
jgi:hypothetical protein